MNWRAPSSAGRTIAVLALALLGVGTWWWLDRHRDDRPATIAERHPDSYFRALDIVRHDAQGRPEIRVQADYAEHFEDQAWIDLENLVATGLVAGPDWRLEADFGRLSDDGTELEAWGDVLLTRLRGGTGESPMRLATERLTVNTQTETATTDQAVTITQGAGVMSGRGLWASLADDRLRLEADVEARYGK